MLSCVQHDKKPRLKELIPTCEKDTDREGLHFSHGCRGLHSLFLEAQMSHKIPANNHPL